jgi:DNA polymerase-1
MPGGFGAQPEGPGLIMAFITFIPMPTLLLVDGSSYLYRAFHAMPDLRTRRRASRPARCTASSTCYAAGSDYKADYRACVFDAKGKTFRDDWYPDYKAHRPPMPDDLAATDRALHECGPRPRLAAADDRRRRSRRRHRHAGAQATERGIDCVVSTGDKDLAQLVNPHVRLVNTMSNEVLDEAGVLAKFGVTPSRHRRLPRAGRRQRGQRARRRQGRPEDGGEVAAAVRLARRHRRPCRRDRRQGRRKPAPAPRLPAAREKTRHGGLRPGAAGEGGRPRAATARQGGSPSSCASGFKTLAPRNPRRIWPLSPRGGEGWGEGGKRGASAARRPSRPLRTILDWPTFDAWLEKLDAAPLARLDTETTSLDPMEARLVGMSFASRRRGRLPAAGAPLRRRAGATAFATKPWRSCGPGWNRRATPSSARTSSTTATCFANHGIRLAGVAHDTLLESYVLEPTSHDMDSLALRHLGIEDHQVRRSHRQGRHRASASTRSVARATDYAAEDADVTLRLHRCCAAPGGRAAPGGALPRHRTAGAADPVPHGAHRRAGGCRARWRQQSTSSA